MTYAALIVSAALLSGPAASSQALRVTAQHTNTSDVRAIAVFGGRVWAATGGGLAIHDASDGSFVAKLTGLDGLAGNSLRAVAAGAEIVMDIVDQDYGGRGYSCRDPQGQVWNFGTHDPWESA